MQGFYPPPPVLAKVKRITTASQPANIKLITHKHITVIGGGPAGLRAAEVASRSGTRVTLYDAMPSVGRKLLVAGKSGLNLTNAEDLPTFLEKYSGPDLPAPLWQHILTSFDNHALRKWAAGLGIDTFVTSGGKVLPAPDNTGTIKAAPLLRRWIERLRHQGVTFKARHRWTGITPNGTSTFSHNGKTITTTPHATILALGGASWPQTGSDGTWFDILSAHNIHITPLTAANCGWETNWPQPLFNEADGLPIKNALITAGDLKQRGEIVITRYGLEGGPLYRLGPAIRSMDHPHIIIDFKPDLTLETITSRLAPVKRNFVREARRRLRLDPATCALLKHLPNRGPWTSPGQLAHEIKHSHIPLIQPRPIAEAISSAGGICWNELDDSLMIKKLPGIFVAGEMIDWEAPTGGYLLQACFATGTRAGHSASRFLIPNS